MNEFALASAPTAAEIFTVYNEGAALQPESEAPDNSSAPSFESFLDTARPDEASSSRAEPKTKRPNARRVEETGPGAAGQPDAAPALVGGAPPADHSAPVAAGPSAENESKTVGGASSVAQSMAAGVAGASFAILSVLTTRSGFGKAFTAPGGTKSAVDGKENSSATSIQGAVNNRTPLRPELVAATPDSDADQLDAEAGLVSSVAASDEAHRLAGTNQNNETSTPNGAAPALNLATNPDGMLTASQDNAMQTMQAVESISAQAGQNLPAAAAISAISRSSESQRKNQISFPDGIGTTTSVSNPSSDSFAGHLPGATVAPPAETTATHRAEGTPVYRSIESAVLGVSRQESGSVEVVLTPDTQTQISLHVKMEQGHLRAQAVLERGDYDALKAGWGNLQSRLAEHGVRLAPLASGTGQGTAFGHSHFSSPRQERESQPENELLVATANKPQTRNSGASAVTARRREWWA